LLDNVLHELDHFEVAQHVAYTGNDALLFEGVRKVESVLDGSSRDGLLDEEGSLGEVL
jgi:hypothetical protein